MENSDLKTNLEEYQAQLKQVEAALMIDEDNAELVKLQSDLLEVIQLTSDLLSINVPVAENKKQSHSLRETDVRIETSKKETSKPAKTIEEQLQYTAPSLETSSTSTTTAATATASEESQKRSYDDADIDFEAMFNLPKRQAATEGQTSENEDTQEGTNETRSKDKNTKLTREEQEKRREQRKKKMLKKQQRVKEIEEQREREKSKWQDFRKAPTKGKGKLRGLMKKSIFASPDTSIGKVGVGTCGIGGRGFTKFESPTQYIYKK